MLRMRFTLFRKLEFSVLIAVVAIFLIQGISTAADYGDPIGTLWGVTAFSNGPHTGTGEGRYQCVEYVKRFYRDALGIDTSNWSGNAYTYYDSAKNAKRGLITMNQGTHNIPLAGDILAFSGGSYGHVAIIAQAPFITTPYVCSSVKILQQNWSRHSAYAYLPLNTYRDGKGRTTYFIGNQSSYKVRAWARPGCALPAPARQVGKGKVATTWALMKRSK